MQVKAATLTVKTAGPMDIAGRAGLAAGAGGAGYLAATHPALQGLRDQGMDALHRAGDFYQGLGQRGMEAAQPAISTVMDLGQRGMEAAQPLISNAQANTQQAVEAVPGALDTAGDFYQRLGQHVMDLLQRGGHQVAGMFGG